MQQNIFERVKVRLEMGKDFTPEMVKELCDAYDSRIAELEGNLTPRAVGLVALWSPKVVFSSIAFRFAPVLRRLQTGNNPLTQTPILQKEKHEIII